MMSVHGAHHDTECNLSAIAKVLLRHLPHALAALTQRAGCHVVTINQATGREAGLRLWE